MDYIIGAWRRYWIAAGLMAWALGATCYVLAWAEIDLPDMVTWALFLGVFPLFGVAIMTHPCAKVWGLRASVGIADGLRGARPFYVVLFISSFIVSLVTVASIRWFGLVSIPQNLSYFDFRFELRMVSAATCSFFACSVMLHSSARTCERAAESRALGSDPPWDSQ